MHESNASKYLVPEYENTTRLDWLRVSSLGGTVEQCVHVIILCYNSCLVPCIMSRIVFNSPSYADGIDILSKYVTNVVRIVIIL